MKIIINIPRKTVPWECKVCKKIVNPNTAKPWVIETDKAIINTWDYRHWHRKMYSIEDDGKQTEIVGEEYQREF